MHFLLAIVLTAIIGVKPREAAKLFANRYACGASVVKGKGDQIDVQGDILSSISELLLKKYQVCILATPMARSLRVHQSY